MKTSLILRATLALAGTLAVLVGYFWVHKPIDIFFVLTFGGVLIDALTAGILIVMGSVIGRRVLARFELSPLSTAERIALYGAVGMGVLAWPVLIMGMMGVLRPLTLWLLLVALMVLLWRDMLLVVRSLIEAGRRTWPQDAGWLRVLAGFVLLAIGLAGLRALAPPYSWDALMYHLVGPQHTLAEGRILAAPDNFYLGFPQSVEMIYTFAIGLFGRDSAAAPIHLAFGLFAMLSSAGLARRYAGELAGYLCAVILMSAFSLWLLAGQPYVDLAVMAYGACVLSLFSLWREDSARKWLILASICAGFAASVKYPAGNLFIALSAAVVLTSPRRALANVLLMGAIGGLVLSPWLLRGMLLYGNSVYPFVFEGLNWSPYRTFLFSGRGHGLLDTPYAWHLPILPLAAAIFGVDKADLYSFSAGPWLLTAPLLLVPVWGLVEARARKLAGSVLMLIAPLLLYWMIVAAFTEPGIQTRLMTAVLPAFAVIGAVALAALERWPRRPLDVRFVMRGLFGFTLVLATIDMVRETVRLDVMGVLMGSTSRSDYLFAKDEVYFNAMRRLQELPAGTQVRLMWEPRGYYCPEQITCIADVLSDHWSWPVVRGETAEQIMTLWRDSGDDYVLVRQLGYQFYLDDDRFAADIAGFRDAIGTYLEPVWTDGADAYTLYTWKP